MKNRLEQIVDDEILSPINGTGKIRTRLGNEYFLKSGIESSTYQNEANGLSELSKTKSIAVVEVVAVDKDFILTKYINQQKPKLNFYTIFGKQLAEVHKYLHLRYGYFENNYIGANLQINIPSEEEKNDWAAFYFNKRLLYQYKLAEKNGYVTSNLKSGFFNLEQRIEAILKPSIEKPCLLHGDLWSGNYLCNNENQVVLIDPAVYYGHREADLAMTKVFGSFPHTFYEAYNKEYPLKEGWEYREGIYKLYHILNHLNIFGQSYLPETEYILKQY